MPATCEENPMQKVRLTETLAQINDHWNPRIVGELNGQHVKLVKFQGDFVWHHHHIAEDEMFLVVRGSFRMDYRDPAGQEQQIIINEGEFLIVPAAPSTAHVRPRFHVLLFEPTSTLNTGNVRNELTVESPTKLVSG